MATPPSAQLTNAIVAAAEIASSDVSYWVPYVPITTPNGQQGLAAPTVGTTAQSPWDFLTLSANIINVAKPQAGLRSTGASFTLPGAASIHFKLKNNYKRAKSQSQDVLTLTDIGRDPHELDIVVKFTGPAAFKQWQQCVKGLNFTATGTDRPVYAIQHMKAQLYGIQFVVLHSLEDPPEAANRVHEVKLRMTEWTQPVPVKPGKPFVPAGQVGSGTPTAAIAGASLP